MLTELGQKLRRQREFQGLLIDDVAEKIKISPRIIGHIEAGNRKGLPHTVYARGFIASYARVLQYDMDELKGELEVIFAEEAQEEVQVDAGPLIHGTAGTVQKIAILLLLGVMLAAVIGGGWLLFSTYGEDLAELIKKPFMAASTISEAPLIDNGTKSSEEGIAITLSPQMLNGTTSSESAPVVDSGITATREVPASVDDHIVEVVVNKGSCWIGYLVDGKDEGAKTFRAGETAHYPYKKSLRLTLGNPSVVSIMHDGKDFGRKLDGSRKEVLEFP